MTKPINLNKVRKDRDRAARKSRADQNAVFHGLTRTEKDAIKARADKTVRTLDGHKRET